MRLKISEIGKFPCECGRAYSTAKKFSDHVHYDCKDGLVNWGNVRPKEEGEQEHG